MIQSGCPTSDVHNMPHLPCKNIAKTSKTYNSGDSLVVTHLTTNPPVHCLYMAERTGSLIFSVLWSYVKELMSGGDYIDGNVGDMPRAQLNQTVQYLFAIRRFSWLSCFQFHLTECPLGESEADTSEHPMTFMATRLGPSPRPSSRRSDTASILGCLHLISNSPGFLAIG